MKLILILLTVAYLKPSLALRRCCYPMKMFNCTDDACKDSLTEICYDGSVPVADKNGRAPNCVLKGGECDEFACNCTNGCKRLKKQTSLKWYVFSVNKTCQ